MQYRTPSESINHYLTKTALAYHLEQLNHEVFLEYNFTSAKGYGAIKMDVYDKTTLTCYEIGDWTNKDRNDFSGVDVVNVPIPPIEMQTFEDILEYVILYARPDKAAKKKVVETGIGEIEDILFDLRDGLGNRFVKTGRYLYVLEHQDGRSYYIKLGNEETGTTFKRPAYYVTEPDLDNPETRRTLDHIESKFKINRLEIWRKFLAELENIGVSYDK